MSSSQSKSSELFETTIRYYALAANTEGKSTVVIPVAMDTDGGAILPLGPSEASLISTQAAKMRNQANVSEQELSQRFIDAMNLLDNAGPASSLTVMKDGSVKISIEPPSTVFTGLATVSLVLKEKKGGASQRQDHDDLE